MGDDLSGGLHFDELFEKFFQKGNIMDIICCKGTSGAKEICAPEYWRYNPDNNCDNVMKNYCLIYSKDPICSCLLSDKNLPHCQDPECQKNGYVPNNMNKQLCPTIINCNQDLSNVEIQKGGTGKLNQIQFCGNDDYNLKGKGDEEILKALDKMYVKPVDEQEQNKFNLKSNWLVILIFIIFLIIVICIAYKIKNNNLNKNI